jgi:alpha-glucosidase
MLALPGGAYIYQGEELALPEVRDIPENRLEDPRWFLSNKTDKGRDGCRVPLPWDEIENGAFGFSKNQELGRENAWLPQPIWWGNYAAKKQDGDANSSLNLYRRALEIRKTEIGLGDGEMEWLELGNHILAFRRPGNFACIVNFGNAFKIPNGEVLVASTHIEQGVLPEDGAIWMRLA